MISLTREHIFAVIMGFLALVVFTIAPFLYGLSQAPEQFTFSGIRDFAHADTFVYYSYLEQVKSDKVLLRNLYTTEMVRPVFNIVWYCFGVLGMIFNLSNVTLLILLQVALGGSLLFCVFYLLGLFLSKYRVPVFSAMLLFGGLGPILYLFNPTTSPEQLFDIASIEHNLSLTLGSSPHIILSTLLLLSTLYLSFRSIESRSTKKAIYAGLVALILFQFHPYYIPVIYGVVFTYLSVVFFSTRTIDWKQARTTVLPLLFLPLPSIMYHVQLLFSERIYMTRVVTNTHQIDSLLSLLLSFSLFLPFACVGIFRFTKERATRKQQFIITWFLVQLLLVVLPFSFQKKFLEGLFFPMTILAWYGIEFCYMHLHEKYKLSKSWIFISSIVLVLFVPSTFFNSFRSFVFYGGNSQLVQAGLVYISPNTLQAYDWIRSNTSEDAIFLSSLDSSVAIPAYALRQVYLGHWSETILVNEEKAPNLLRFFDSNTSHDWRKVFLYEQGITYVWYGENEQEFSFNPGIVPSLESVYQNGDITIFKVIN